MVKVYKYKNNQIVEVECEEKRYPLTDSDGDTIFDNTHFFTKKEAYQRAIVDAKAGVSLITQNIIQLREKEEESQKQLVDMCILLNKFENELFELELKENN